MFEESMRRMMKGNEIEDIKAAVFREVIKIDDPIDRYSKHTMLHDSIIMSREQVFYFLLQQGANPMVRDTNGYTPLLKAAALCKSDFVKYLVEKKGVDPRHTDPFGNTPREKAELYLCQDVADYLAKMEQKAKKGELKLQDHSKFNRSNLLYTKWFDY